MKLEAKELTKEEENAIYGKRIVNIGKCFKTGFHIFKQLEFGVLHVNMKDRILINILHEGYLNNTNLKEMNVNDFDQQLSNTLVELSSFLNE